jgi:hypothetical protein
MRNDTAMPALRPAVLRARVKALREAGDAAGLVRLLAAAPAAAMPPNLAALLCVTALERDDPAGIEAAVRVAVTASLPPTGRAAIAWRLAYAGHADRAWIVLHCDPAVILSAAARRLVLQLLRRIADGRRVEAALALAARSLLARLARARDLPRQPAPYAYPAGEGGPRPGSMRSEWAEAPGLPPAARAAFAQQLDGFERLLAAGRPAPVVGVYEDVLVNRHGQVWQPDGILLRGHDRPLAMESLAATAAAPRCEAAAFAIEPHGNMFHWAADTLPGLAWRFAEGVPPMPLLIEDAPDPFKPESLRALGGGTMPPVVSAGDAIRVGRLYIGTFEADALAPEGAHRAVIAGIAAAADAAPAPAGEACPLLYISRRDATRRPMLNEAVLEEALAARGFGIRRFAEHGFLEKLRLVRDARLIVAPHGAALGLLAYARPGTRVFEIMPAATQAAALRLCIARLCRLLALRHRLWLEPVAAPGASWSVSLGPLLDDLDAWTGGIRSGAAGPGSPATASR